MSAAWSKLGRGVWLGVFMLVATLHLAGAAWAQQRQGVPVELETVRQKAFFIGNLATNSVSVQTIETTGDAAAKAALETARALVAQANEALERGDIKVADDKLNHALALINEETRRLSQDQFAEERQRESFDERLKTVRLFLAAYQRVAGSVPAESGLAALTEELTSIIAEAEAKARDGRLEEAKAMLDRAYLTTTRRIGELRDGDTLVRSLIFETPKDEYVYEIDRNDTHFYLLKIAREQRAAGGVPDTTIDDLRTMASDLRAAADRKAGSDDHPGAIHSLEESTNTLIKAIRMSGLYIPG